MTLHHRNRPGRAGFTLIELLVVITIIAILTGLATVAAFRLLGRGSGLKARNDLSQLSAALSGFKEVFPNVDHVPSRIMLTEAGPWPQGTQLERDSRAYIKNMFPGIDLDGSTVFNWNGNVDASGNVIVDGPHILEGHYCLVFFLGGIPDQNNNVTLRFSTNNRNPTQAGGERRGREFNFKPEQLVRGYNGFFYYKDPWDSPYAYFSAYRKANGYNRYGTSDCASITTLTNELPTVLAPYIKATTSTGINQYYNPESFQIISAGKDKKFGAGGAWTPGDVGAPTEDNMSNFHDGMMK